MGHIKIILAIVIFLGGISLAQSAQESSTRCNGHGQCYSDSGGSKIIMKTTLALAAGILTIPEQ